MIEYLGAIFLVIGFIFIVRALGLVEKSSRVISISRQAVAELRDIEMSEDDKESAMQSHAKQLAGFFFLITFGGLAALFLPIAVIWVFDRLNFMSIDAVLAITLSWPFLVTTSLLIVAALYVKRTR